MRVKKKADHQNFVTYAIPLQQVAPTAAANQAYKKAYTGPHPLCPTCNFHHMPTKPFRFCTNCNCLGRFSIHCRLPKAQANQANIPLLTAPRQLVARACFQCGEPNHFINVCPLRANNNNNIVVAPNNQANQGARGRVFNVNANLDQDKNEGVNNVG
ncbi:hypothetical protein R6Q57_007533 [Mikania cordata]